MYPRVKIYPCITMCMCGNHVSPICSDGHLCWRKLFYDNYPKSHLRLLTLLERPSLLSHIIHHYICDAESVSSSLATEEQSTALNRQRTYCGREAPGKARPQVTTERLAEVPGTDVIFGVSVLVSSSFRCEVSPFDSPSITLGDTINKSVRASPLSLKKEKLKLLTIIIEN